MSLEPGTVLPSDPEAQAADRVERSRQALVQRFPELEKHLAATPLTRLVRDGAAAVDIDLGNARLYGTDARPLTDGQVKAYLERPLRFYVLSVRGANIGSPVSTRMFEFILDTCRELGVGIEDLEAKPQYEGGYLVILGLGLGYHLAELFERTRAHHVILIEPYADFLLHSLSTVDWPALLEAHEARGGQVSIAIPNSPDQAVNAIQEVFQRQGLPFIDGAYVFLHYPAWLLFETRDRLAQRVENLFLSRGFYEDELIMISNTLANLASHRFHLVDNFLRPARSEPVFIIGSGPSIDQSIEHVKRLRERAVVISCGSGLKVCFSHGIVPDFHCEIENGDWVYDALQLTSADHSLAGITLIAPTSVDPRVPPLFEHTLLFFRDSISGTQVVADLQWEVFWAVPTVGNTALRIGMGLGFSSFYLFGIDCGSKYTDKRHSNKTIYAESAQFKKYEDQMEMVYTHEGNFGGWIKADWIFNFSRLFLEHLIGAYAITVTNCSDGAKIRGTKPRLASGLTLTTPPLDRAEIKARIFKHLRECAPGELLSRVSYELFLQENRRFRADALAMVDAALAEDRDFVGFWKRLFPFLDTSLENYARLPAVIKSSMLSIPKIGMFIAHRIRDDEARYKVFMAFLEEYRRIIEFMADGLEERLEQLARDYPVPAA
jgi:hypothetical protein